MKAKEEHKGAEDTKAAEGNAPRLLQKKNKKKDIMDLRIGDMADGSRSHASHALSSKARGSPSDPRLRSSARGEQSGGEGSAKGEKPPPREGHGPREASAASGGSFGKPRSGLSTVAGVPVAEVAGNREALDGQVRTQKVPPRRKQRTVVPSSLAAAAVGSPDPSQAAVPRLPKLPGLPVS